MANTVAGKNGKKRVPEGVRRPARAARVYSAVTASLPRALQKVVEEDKNMNSAYQRTDFDYEADFAPDFGTHSYVFQSGTHTQSANGETVAPSNACWSGRTSREPGCSPICCPKTDESTFQAGGPIHRWQRHSRPDRHSPIRHGRQASSPFARKRALVDSTTPHPVNPTPGEVIQLARRQNRRRPERFS